MKRFLCTTALEESWREDQPLLFLGEWCRKFARKERWSRLDAEVLPYHWDDRAKLYADYQFLRGLHERLLTDLRAQMNEIHRVDHGLRYWRILVGPWLGYFTQMLFDRWVCIHQAIRERELSGTIILRSEEDSLVPNDMGDFARLFVSDEWNHELYAHVLQHAGGVPCVTKPWRAAPAAHPPVMTGSWKQRVKLGLARVCSRAASTLTRDQDAFLMATYMPAAAEASMHLRLGQVPQLWQPVAAVRASVAPARRAWTLRGTSHGEFEAFARELIPAQLPTAYLEGYDSLIAQTEWLPWPRRPKFIWTSNAHCFDDVFKAWAAGKAEQGSPLVIGQHGGHYGMGRWCFTEEHDIEIGDCYLSWGWSEPGKRKVRPVGQLKAKRPLGVRHSRRPHALLVTNDLSRYSYMLYSASVARQWLDYFDDQCTFVEHLPRRVRDALIVRTTAVDYGWDQVSRWRERFPNLRVDAGRSNINDLIRQSRLYISTYNATTYLESLTMQVPTVIYWNPRHWELRESAIPQFEALKQVGIFHETPESAAAHVAAIWDNVQTWWADPAVAEVRRKFQRRYCDLPRDLADRVAAALRDVIAQPGRSAVL